MIARVDPPRPGLERARAIALAGALAMACYQTPDVTGQACFEDRHCLGEGLACVRDKCVRLDAAYCGNGEREHVTTDEACDDFNDDDDDGCSSDCELTCAPEWTEHVVWFEATAEASTVVVEPDGSVIAAGWSEEPEQDQGWIAKWDSGGQTQYATKIEAPGCDTRILAAASDGQTVIAAGWRRCDGDTIAPWRAEIGATGSPTWERLDEPHELSADPAYRAVALHPAGGIVVADSDRVYFFEAPDAEEPAWMGDEAVVTEPSLGIRRLALSHLGDLAVAGSEVTAEQGTNVFVRVLNVDGEHRWTHWYDGQGGADILGGVAWMADGSMLVGGVSFHSSLTCPTGWLDLVGADGQRRATAELEAPCVVISDVTVSGNDLFAVGSRSGEGYAYPWMVRVDEALEPAWALAQGGGEREDEMAAAVAARPGGGIVVAGRIARSPAQTGYWVAALGEACR